MCLIFQQLYNIADSFVAGKLIGEEALAAVGNSYEITLIFIAFAFGCNMGCSVIVSQLFGAKKTADMKTAVNTSLITTAAVCTLLMAAGFAASSGLLALIQTPDNIFADLLLYLNIYILSLPFVFLAVSSTANVGVDILFVAGFGMGVDGVAWATFICQGVSCILAVVFVFRRLAEFKTEKKARLFSSELFRKISAVAVPSILQQGFISAGNIMIQGVINGFGSGVIAGYSAAVK